MKRAFFVVSDYLEGKPKGKLIFEMNEFSLSFYSDDNVYYVYDKEINEHAKCVIM